MIKVILFDYNGTLTDKDFEDITSRALTIDMTKQEKMKMFWKNYIKFAVLYPYELPYCEEFFSMLEKDSNKEVNRDMLERMKLDFKTEEFRSEAKDVLEYSSKKYILGIFTGYSVEQKKKRLQDAGFLKYIKYCFPQDTKITPKPSIDVFKHIQEVLGVEKDEIILIDDNISRGIIPAKRFGWKACFFNTTKYVDINQIPDDFRPDYVIKNLAELKNIF